MTGNNVRRPDNDTGHTTSARRVIIGDFLSVTWRMTVPTVVGVALGYWMDTALQSSPFGFIAGAVVGFAVGIYMAVRIIIASKETR